MPPFEEHFILAHAALNKKKCEEAIKHYSLAIKANKNHPDRYSAFYHRGIAWQNLKFYTHAIRDFTLAIHTLPADSEEYFEEDILQYKQKAYYYRGNAESQLKQYENAIENYSSAIELGLNTVEVYYNRGCTLAKLGETIEAIDDLKQAKTLNDDLELLKKIEDLIQTLEDSIAPTPPFSDEEEDPIEDCPTQPAPPKPTLKLELTLSDDNLPNSSSNTTKKRTYSERETTTSTLDFFPAPHSKRRKTDDSQPLAHSTQPTPK